MIQIPYVPKLSSYVTAQADDVASAKSANLPMRQRVYAHQPYTAIVSFLLNGAQHDELMQIWRDNAAMPVQLQLKVEDSTLRWYECMFTEAPAVEYRGGDHPEWLNTHVNGAPVDNSQSYYESFWTFDVRAPHRRAQDLAVVSAYEMSTKDPFRGYIFGEYV